MWSLHTYIIYKILYDTLLPYLDEQPCPLSKIASRDNVVRVHRSYKADACPKRVRLRCGHVSDPAREMDTAADGRAISINQTRSMIYQST